MLGIAIGSPGWCVGPASTPPSLVPPPAPLLLLALPPPLVLPLLPLLLVDVAERLVVEPGPVPPPTPPDMEAPGSQAPQEARAKSDTSMERDVLPAAVMSGSYRHHPPHLHRHDACDPCWQAHELAMAIDLSRY
jgi:hypothetical protein